MYQSSLFIFHIAMVFMLIGFGIFFWMIFKKTKTQKTPPDIIQLATNRRKLYENANRPKK